MRQIGAYARNIFKVTNRRSEADRRPEGWAWVPVWVCAGLRDLLKPQLLGKIQSHAYGPGHMWEDILLSRFWPVPPGAPDLFTIIVAGVCLLFSCVLFSIGARFWAARNRAIALSAAKPL
jgi:hypothetical protein